MSEGATTRVEREFDALMRERPDRASEAVEQMCRMLAERRVQFGGKALPTSIKPHFIRRSENEVWTSLLERLLVVLEDTARFLSDTRLFREMGPFPRESWELFDIDPGYPSMSVVCRPDVLWEGGRIGVLEMNADSPAMMLYADVLQDIGRELFPLRDLDRDGALTFDHRVPALLQALLATYRQWGGTSARPVIAIVDWKAQKTASEQEELARNFTALGCPSFVCTPEELELRGGRLVARGEPIDIVQRRLLFPTIVRNLDVLRPLITAYREHAVCMVNPLRSYLVGCKAVLAELSRRLEEKELGPAEAEVVSQVVPRTVCAQNLDEAELSVRTRWVLKPAFGSGGAGVVIGRYADEQAWSEAVRVARKTKEWVAQTFLAIPLYRLPLTTASTPSVIPLYANWNPFIFGGVAAGGIARVSSDPVVGISARGALIPTLIVNDE